MSKFDVFAPKLHVATSDDEKITWGPALTRKATTFQLCFACLHGAKHFPELSVDSCPKGAQRGV